MNHTQEFLIGLCFFLCWFGIWLYFANARKDKPSRFSLAFMTTVLLGTLTGIFYAVCIMVGDGILTIVGHG